MQKAATRVFVSSSIVFGVVGILIVFLGFERDTPDTYLTGLLMRTLMLCVFIILSSFAVSIAGKYLDGDSFKSRDRK